MNPNDNREEVYATLSFDSDVDYDKVARAEELLRAAGVTFDTGTSVTGEPRHDWILDWSLEGASLYEHEQQEPPEL